MAWLRIDDRVRTHPKIAQAGPAAAWLWFCGICYCREHLTDGHIPKPVVSGLALNLPNPQRHASRLVAVRLWHEHPDTFEVHDFLDWNPSRASVMSLRDKERDKKRTQRGHAGDSRERADAGAGDAGSGLGSASGSEALSEGFSDSEESARETANMGGRWEPVNTLRPSHGGPLVDGRAIRQHAQHAWCSWPDRDGLCVLSFLHSEFMGKGGLSEAELRPWYAATVRRFEGVAVGEDALTFWRREFAAWMGTASASTRGSRTGDSTDAAKEYLRHKLPQLDGGE